MIVLQPSSPRWAGATSRLSKGMLFALGASKPVSRPTSDAKGTTQSHIHAMQMLMLAGLSRSSGTADACLRRQPQGTQQTQSHPDVLQALQFGVNGALADWMIHLDPIQACQSKPLVPILQLHDMHSNSLSSKGGG